jgi:DNA polymerase
MPTITRKRRKRSKTLEDAARPAAGEAVPTEPIHIPAKGGLDALRKAAASCRACPLWKSGTQTVFGEGPKNARVLMIGEQPGDQEDRAGRPFVGPAGKLLDRALIEAGVDRSQVYVTNAVKHFKWEPRGPRRIHKKPNAREIRACRPWLEAEVDRLQPELIVCLGATAAQSVHGPAIRVTQQRGEKLETSFGIPSLITIHPSALLRLPPGADRKAEFARFVDDLRKIG